MQDRAHRVHREGQTHAGQDREALRNSSEQVSTLLCKHWPEQTADKSTLRTVWTVRCRRTLARWRKQRTMAAASSAVAAATLGWSGWTASKGVGAPCAR